MVDIAKKRLPAPLVAILVYISYCAMNWYSSRGVIAYYLTVMFAPSSPNSALANDAVAFFFGGLIPFAFYYLVSSTMSRSLSFRIREGNLSAVRYGLNLTVIAANVVLFLFKFSYIAMPLAAPIVEIMINPIVTVMFVALYSWYAFKMQYVDKSRFSAVLVNMFGTFLFVYGILAVINILVYVM